MGTPISYISGYTGTYSIWTHNRSQVSLNLNEKLNNDYRWWNGVDISSQYLLNPLIWPYTDIDKMELLNDIK